MIWILGVQDSNALTGAPTAAAMAFTRAVMKAVKAGFCPVAAGHMPVSQRAIFPVSFVGALKALANLSSTSRDLVAVTVTSSCGAPGGACAHAARMETVSVAAIADTRTIL